MENYSKKQIITFMGGIMAIVIMIAGYFTYTGIRTQVTNDELMEKVNELSQISKNQKDNNDKLKEIVNELETEKDVLEQRINDLSTMEHSDYDVNINEEDTVTAEMLNNEGLTPYLLKVAFTRSHANTEFSGVVVIDWNHIYAREVVGNFRYIGTVYEVSYEDSVISFEPVMTNEFTTLDDNDEYIVGNRTLVIEQLIDLNTMENLMSTVHTAGIEKYWDSDFDQYIEPQYIVDDEGVHIQVKVVDYKTGESTRLEDIPSEQWNWAGHPWNADNTKVNINGSYIYDVLNKTVIDFENYPEYVHSSEGTKDYVCVIIKEEDDENHYFSVKVYDWNGKEVKTISLKEQFGPVLVGFELVDGHVEQISGEMNVVVVYYYDNEGRHSCIINLDSGETILVEEFLLSYSGLNCYSYYEDGKVLVTDYKGEVNDVLTNTMMILGEQDIYYIRYLGEAEDGRWLFTGDADEDIRRYTYLIYINRETGDVELELLSAYSDDSGVITYPVSYGSGKLYMKEIYFESLNVTVK